ncbi:MAG TPA: DAK2 domain-containing protein [Candidatus Acidoferrales bacterium]|nr:DAK2 domain-containing protein [Candidatus Acidoferrales bacterium]
MSRRGTDGEGLLDAVRGALALLEQSADSINALNVFPVPDGDTGSNMLATLRAALAEAEALPADDRSVGSVAAAVGHGALMGARGNSGVILSQILRGMAEALAGRSRMSALDLAHALTTGSQKAHSAVLKPVEGTILTVVRETAVAAVAAAEHNPDMETVLGAAVEAAEQAVARTPSLLPVLREAGVVDAGGEGLYRILQGALRALVARAALGELGGAEAPHPAAVIAKGEDGFGYETMFLVTPATGRSLDLDAIRVRLSELGESVLVAGDGRAAKVHVHGERPDQVLAFGLSLGPLSHVTVENLDRQAREAREARAHAFAGEAPAAQLLEADGAIAVHDPADHRHPELVEHLPDFPGLHVGPPIVAVASGDGIVAIFRSFGVADVVGGGQSANPSAGELLRAAQELGTHEVLLLPNNSNVKLAAEQAAALARGTRIVVVPTRNPPEGFAALLAYDAGRDAQANAGTMLAAARSVQTLQVTDAIRDAKIGGRKVRKGHAIVLDPDDGLVATDANRQEAVMAGVALLRPGYELLTVYYGDGADLAEAEGLTTALRGRLAGVEVELVHGGQPYYRYLLAAE